MTQPDLTRRETPAAIYIALVCFAFMVVSPFIGGMLADRSHGDGWHSIGVVLPWVLASGLAAIVGAICTLIGAWSGPRSVPTIIASVIASVVVLLLTMLLGFSLR